MSTFFDTARAPQSQALASAVSLSRGKRLKRAVHNRRMACHGVSKVLEATTLSAPLNDTETVILYTHVLCPYAQRAWLALLEKGVLFALVNVDLSSKPRWFSQVNPAGLVPAVAWQGHVQTESLDICRWVDEAFEGPPLIPNGADGAVTQLIRNSSRFSSAGLSLLAGSTGRSWGIGTGQTSSQKQAFQREVDNLSKTIEQSGGPFLAGSPCSLADLAYFPFAERFDVAMPTLCGYNLRQNVTVRKWLEAMEAREAVRTCAPNRDLLLKAFRKHMSLDFFDFHTYTATSLHPQLQ